MVGARLERYVDGSALSFGACVSQREDLRMGLPGAGMEPFPNDVAVANNNTTHDRVGPRAA